MRFLMLAATVLAASFSSVISAQSSTCAPLLVTSQVHWQFDTSLRLSILKIIDRNSFSQSKHSFGGGIKFPVDGLPIEGFSNYDDFDQARQRDFQKTSFKWEKEEAQNYVASFLPDALAERYLECLRIDAQNSYGLHVITKEISPNFISFDLLWNPPPGQRDLTLDTVRIEGISDAPPVKVGTAIGPNAIIPLDLHRVENQPFRFTVAGGGFPAARLSVPVADRGGAQKQFWENLGYRPRLDILAHIQSFGDIHGSEAQWVGTKGKSLRLEGFQIDIRDKVPGLSVEYMCHLQRLGDSEWKTGGQFCGTRGESRRLEGFAVRLAGEQKEFFSVQYQCHVQGSGDSEVYQDGQFCGTRGQSKRVEALLIHIERVK